MTISRLPKPPSIKGLPAERALEVLETWANEIYEAVGESLSRIDKQFHEKQYPILLPSATVAQLGTTQYRPLTPARLMFCSDETGGQVPVFSDGTDWRRVTDRSIVA